MATAAFMTYNSIDGILSGMHQLNGNKAIVLSNTKGHKWAVKEIAGEERPDNYDRGESQYQNCVRSEIDTLFESLSDKIEEIDTFVVYVGSSGSERAIELAKKFPPSKLVFVGCDCGLNEKTRLLEVHGLGSAKKMLCECGGSKTMRQLFDHFFHCGVVTHE